MENKGRRKGDRPGTVSYDQANWETRDRAEGLEQEPRAIKQIAVHDGPFHGDDVLALALLEILYPKAQVIRTRLEDELQKADLRVDVGGKSNGRTGDFDHHFNNSPRRPNGATYAAAGLVWDYYGELILATFDNAGRLDLTELKNFLDEIFFEDLDRLDTGQGGSTQNADDVSWALCALTPTWQEIETKDNLETERFKIAVQNVREFLQVRLNQVVNSESLLEVTNCISELKKDIIAWGADRRAEHARACEDARAIVFKAVEQAKNGVAVMPQRCLPWQDSLHEAETILGKKVWHVIDKAGENKFMLTAVAVEKGSFVSRMCFPETWGGQRAGDLAEASGLPGAVFCHPGRWCSGWGNLEEAIEAARLTRISNLAPARPEDEIVKEAPGFRRQAR